MNKVLEYMQKFCDGESKFEIFHKPYKMFGKVTATNGMVLIRSNNPRISALEVRPSPMRIEEIATAIKTGIYRPVTDLHRRLPKKTKCKPCNGTGKICQECNGKRFVTLENAFSTYANIECANCDRGRSTPRNNATCTKCKGKKVSHEENTPEVTIFKRNYHLKHIELIYDKPNLEMAYSESLEILLFKFDGFDGCIMPNAKPCYEKESNA